MLEKAIERRLVMEVKKHGGICPKWTSPGMAGMPDRLLLLPEGKIAMVEVKKKGQKPRALQLARHKLLMDLGFKVYVLDDIEMIRTIIDEVENETT